MNPFTPPQKVSRRTAKKIASKEFLQQLKRGQLPPDIPRNFLFKQLRYVLTEKEADRIIDQLDDETYAFVQGVPIAESYAAFCKDTSVFEDDLNAELLWTARNLQDYAAELEMFTGLEQRYTRSLLLGDYTQALAIIDQIERTVSYSNWTMQQKLIIAEFEKGFKANKNLLSSLLSKENSTVTNFISSYTSIRIEKNISPLQYDNILNDYLKAVDKNLHDFIRLKVDFFKGFDYKEYSSILNIESRQTIIDQFVAFKQVAMLLLCQKEILTKHKIGTVKQAIRHLQPLIPNDPALRVLALFADNLPGPHPGDVEFLKLTDDYTSGDYRRVVEFAPTFIRQYPASYQAILLYVKSLINCGEAAVSFSANDCIVDQLIGHLYRILRKGDDFDLEIFADAFKFVHQLGDHALANGLFYLLTQELPFRFNGERQVNLFKFYLGSSATLNPAHHQFLSESIKGDFFTQLQQGGESSPTIDLISRIQAAQLQLSDPQLRVRDLKYLAIVLENKNRLVEALPLYNRIMASPEYAGLAQHAHYELDILIGRYHCLCKMGAYEQAMELAASALVHNERFQERFFMPLLLDKLMGSDSEELAGNINLPVYLAFYKGNIESYELYVAYDNYLERQDAEKPSELIKQLIDYKPQDICFLEKVCVHEVLHSSPAFENQEELDLERLEICNFLLGKSAHTAAIEAEISELWRKILVRKGIKHINFSKIYVDVAGLKELLRVQLRENFNRNIEIASLPPDQLEKIVDSLGNLLVYYFEKDDDQETDSEQPTDEQVKEHLKKNLKLTSYSRFAHFKEAFLKIRDQFIENKDHGLDTYLSMRIRHGTLLGQIRSVFETHNLITVKNESGNEYLPNEYWNERFGYPELNELLNETLGKFSKQVDELAEQLKAETVQIRTEKSKGSKGLFDFSYHQDGLLQLFQATFGAIRDFEVFMEKGLEELWKRTEHGLTDIKIHLNVDMVSKLETIFNEVEGKLSTLSFSESEPAHAALQDLMSTLRKCQTAITVEMQNISEWFNRSNKKIIEEFDFELLINSNVDTLKNVNPLFAGADIETTQECQLILDGDLFPHFTDILYYLLENALKHSKLPSSELRIAVAVIQEGERIRIRVRNNIWDDLAHLAHTRQNIATTKQKIESEKTYEDINKEGGTGFPKIKKTLKHDIKRKDFTINLELGTDEQNKPFFQTELTFETAHLPIIVK